MSPLEGPVAGLLPLCLPPLFLTMDKNRVIGYFSGIR
jgi:hypothetical protein